MGKSRKKNVPPPIHVEVGGRIFEAISSVVEALAKLLCKLFLYFRKRLDMAIKNMCEDSRKETPPKDSASNIAP